MKKEKFEVVEICDGSIKALFTNERICRMDLPDEVNLYHIRTSSTGEIKTVEKSVMVDHGGCLITKQPLDFKNKDYIDIENDINFLGEEETISEFLYNS